MRIEEWISITVNCRCILWSTHISTSLLLSALHRKAPALEETYFTTRKLPYGFQIKGGESSLEFRQGEWAAWTLLGFRQQAADCNGTIWWGRIWNEVGFKATWLRQRLFFLVAGAEVLNVQMKQSFGTTGVHKSQRQRLNRCHSGTKSFNIGFARASFDYRRCVDPLRHLQCGWNNKKRSGLSGGMGMQLTQTPILLAVILH